MDLKIYDASLFYRNFLLILINLLHLDFHINYANLIYLYQSNLVKHILLVIFPQIYRGGPVGGAGLRGGLGGLLVVVGQFAGHRRLELVGLGLVGLVGLVVRGRVWRRLGRISLVVSVLFRASWAS